VKNSTKVFASVAVVLLSITASYAGGLDPAITFRNPQLLKITGLSFSFDVSNRGFEVLHFLNDSGDSGVSWHDLVFSDFGVPTIDVQCSNGVFSCSVVALGKNGAKIVLTALHGGQGLPSDTRLEIVPGCANGNCPLWPSGADFTAIANVPDSVPEPATLTLLATGVGLLASQHRKSVKAA
jgi:hypothetical protein